VIAAVMVMQALAGMAGAAIAGALGDHVSVVNLLTAQGAGYALAGILMRVLAGRGPADLTEVRPEPAPTTAESATIQPDPSAESASIQPDPSAESATVQPDRVPAGH